MTYKCVCGVYVPTALKLCTQCAADFGQSYTEWPIAIRLAYNELNNGGDYAFHLEGVRSEPIGNKRAKGDNTEPANNGIKTSGGRVCPICQARVKPKERLCRTHLAQYGTNKQSWPEWLKVLTTSDQAILDAARNHPERSIDDEYFPPGVARQPQKGKGKLPGSGGRRTYARIYSDDLDGDFTDLPDNAGDVGGVDALPAGAFVGDKSGAKYNAAAWSGSQAYADFGGLFIQLENIDEKIALMQLLERMEPITRRVLELYGDGHTQAEIADMMSMRQQKVSEIIEAVKSANYSRSK